MVGFEINGQLVSADENGCYTLTMPERSVTCTAVYDAVDLTLNSSTLVVNGVSVEKTLSTYIDGSNGASFSKYFVTKGTTTDGTYIYAILNANTGSTKGKGFDVGIIAKFDKYGKFLDATTANAYQWGNVARIAFVDGYLIVTNTNAVAYSGYNDTVTFNGKNLCFNTNLELVSDDYKIEYPGAPEGKQAALIAEQRTGDYLCVVYDTGVHVGEYTICIYKQNADGGYELVAQNDSASLNAESNGYKMFGVWCADNYIYCLYSTTAKIHIKLINYSGEILFDRTLNQTGETNAEKSNYQSIFEIGDTLYYSIANWSDYKGFGLYTIDYTYTYERIYDYKVTFDSNGADATYPMQIVTHGSKVAQPETPTFVYTAADGTTYNFVFENWYNGDYVWDFDNDVVTSDMTLRAKWTLEDSFFAEKENPEVRADGTTIRAMSFNVLCDDYNNKPEVAPRVEGAVNTILKYAPDVAGLQECDDQWYAALAADERFSAKYQFVNYATTSDNKIAYNGKNYTNYSTIIYNTEVLELVEWTQMHLVNHSNNECRTLTIAVFTIKESGKQFIFTSTHWALTPNERIEQAEWMKPVIDEWRAKYPEAEIILSGDYNANDSETSILTLMEQNNLYESKDAVTVGLACKSTHIGNGMHVGDKDKTNPIHWLRGRISFTAQHVMTTECIDHILISDGVESLYYDTIHDDEALEVSDHMPIYCDLKF